MKKRKRYSVSIAEKEILILLKQKHYVVKPQFKIEGIPYIYDFYFPELNLICEYYGDFFHANPKKYKPDTLIKMPGLGLVSVDFIWARDKFKLDCAKKKGFKVKYIWEADYIKHGWKAIKRKLTN